MPNLLRKSHNPHDASSSSAPHHAPPSLHLRPPTSASDVDAPTHTNTPHMSSTFTTHKSRRVRFSLALRILDLNNVPLVSGTSFIKWHLPSSTAAEHRGKTPKCAIREHRVEYGGYEKRVQVRLTVGKDGMLQECWCEFEVLQEYSAGGRGERIRLGDVRVNLAEYVEPGNNNVESPASPTKGETDGIGEEGVVRRYLMQSSKINSTLKLGISMRHLEGTRDYYAPPLRTAPVFGGIAGIIHSSEPAGAAAAAATLAGGANGNNANNNLDAGTREEGDGPNPNSFSARNKEVGEMQDMYRRTLAAFWASQPGELKADDAIEDIFSGGDGWGKNGRPQAPDPDGDGRNGAAAFEAGSGTTTPNLEPEGGRPHASSTASKKMRGHTGRGIMQMSAGGGGGGRHKHSSSTRQGGRGGGKVKGQGEVDEFEIREDLRSWRVGDTGEMVGGGELRDGG